MSRSEQFTQGRRNGVKWAIEWLHKRATEMNDDHAKAVLNSAATNMGWECERSILAETALKQ